MKKRESIFVLVLLLLFQANIFAGFGAGTAVSSCGILIPIEQLQVGDLVDCYGQDSGAQRYLQKAVTCKQSHTATDYLVLAIGESCLTLSPDQKLYLPEHQEWLAARDCAAGDLLLGRNGLVSIDDIFTVHEPVTFFDITVQDCHNFLVLPDGILVHNFLPVFVGVCGAFGAGAVEWSLCGGVLALGAWIGIRACRNKERERFEFNFNLQNNDANGAQAPGIPTEKDGFVPPKNWDGKRVKNPNGLGYGWKDKYGNIWVPSGPKGHGGPHWDVQLAGGGYQNIVPGGNVRGKK
jgi:hypothetical protein